MKALRRVLKAAATAALLLVGGAVGSYVPQVAAQLSGTPGVLVSGLGSVIFSILAMPAGTVLIGQSPAQNPSAVAISGDATINAAGVLTVTKTNGTSFGTAASANTGTSGANVPLLNAANTFSSLQSFQNHVASAGSAPTLSSCGTSPAIVGDDKDGQVTMGTGSPTGCVITFAAAYTSAPLCTVTWQGTPLASQSYTVTAPAITTVQTATSSNKLNYHCAAQSGG